MAAQRAFWKVEKKKVYKEEMERTVNKGTVPKCNCNGAVRHAKAQNELAKVPKQQERIFGYVQNKR